MHTTVLTREIDEVEWRDAVRSLTGSGDRENVFIPAALIIAIYSWARDFRSCLLYTSDAADE